MSHILHTFEIVSVSCVLQILNRLFKYNMTSKLKLAVLEQLMLGCVVAWNLHLHFCTLLCVVCQLALVLICH